MKTELFSFLEDANEFSWQSIHKLFRQDVKFSHETNRFEAFFPFNYHNFFFNETSCSHPERGWKSLYSFSLPTSGKMAAQHEYHFSFWFIISKGNFSITHIFRKFSLPNREEKSSSLWETYRDWNSIFLTQCLSEESLFQVECTMRQVESSFMPLIKCHWGDWKVEKEKRKIWVGQTCFFSVQRLPKHRFYVSLW